MKDGTKNILRMAGMGKQIDRLEVNQCPFCGVVINQKDFTSELSKKEFTLSGLCQKCQDETFTGKRG